MLDICSILCLPRMLPLPLPPTLRSLLIVMPYAPHTHPHPNNTRHRSDQIRTPIALQPLPAIPHSIPPDDTMSVVDPPIHQIENIPKRNRRERHSAPILTQPSDTKRLHHQRGVHPEQKSVRHPSETRDEPERIWRGDSEAAQLREEEEQRGDEEAPEAGHVEVLDDDVGAHAAQEAAAEGTEGEDLDVS